MKTAALGTTQKDVLRCLADHGAWHTRAGWCWNSTSGTRRLFDALVRRGLVTTTVVEGRTIYTLTAEGRRVTLIIDKERHNGN